MDARFHGSEFRDYSPFPPVILAPLPHGFGFSFERISRACKNPSNRHEINWNGLKVTIFCHDRGGPIDIVGAAVNHEEFGVVFAFEVFPDLCDDPITEMSPLQLLEAFAERFGVVMQVGGRTGRYFFEYGAALTGPLAEPTPADRMFSFPAPPDRTYFLSHATRDDLPHVHIALAFCVDVELYGYWVMSH
jgi:hypothetical protein